MLAKEPNTGCAVERTHAKFTNSVCADAGLTLAFPGWQMRSL